MSSAARWVAVLAGTLVTIGLAVQPAVADDTAPPVVENDSVSLYPGQSAVLDVLANDTSPSGDDLALCRFPRMDPWDEDLQILVLDMSLEYDEEVGTVGVATHPRAKPGTFVFDYYVCDHARLVPAQLTVVIREVQPVDVTTAPDRPGYLLVTNHNHEPIRFVFGHRQAYRADGDVEVAAGATVAVHVQRRRILWIAAIGDFDSNPGIADYGIVRGIKLDGPPLPPPHYRAVTAAEQLPRWADS